MSPHPERVFEHMLKDNSWYELPKLAEADPEAFLKSLWPWFLKVLKHISWKSHPFLTEYRIQSSLAKIYDDERRESPLIMSFVRAITKLAEECPAAFLAFMKQWESQDYLIVQRFLALGLITIAATHAVEGLQFLLADPRRLIIGHLYDSHKETKALIAAIAYYLTDNQIHQLEKAVMRWSHYRTIPANWDAKTKQYSLRWDRAHRLSILKVFPKERFSPNIQQLIHQEETALQDCRDIDKKPVEFQQVVSPMSSDQMTKARDEHILKLFAELVDNTDRSHPRDFMRGGSIEASQAFGEFAKKNPDRAVFIINNMLPGIQERPVSYAIEALAETNYPSNMLFSLIKDLNQKGFTSKEFRTCAAFALGKRVENGRGLPDEMCSLLESWLSEPWTLQDFNADDDRGTHHEKETATNNKDTPESILWGYGNYVAIPQGTYTVLETLTRAYLSQKPMKTSRWLALLKKHLNQPKSPYVWKMLSLYYLKFLFHCEHKEATEFLKSLFAMYPEVLESEYGAVLIAHVHSWIDGKELKGFIHKIRKSHWKDGSQAYGELLFLRCVWLPNETWSQRELQELLNVHSIHLHDINIYVGIAYAASNFWGQLEVRSFANEVFIKLIPLANDAISKAINDVFRLTDNLSDDEQTDRLLETLIDYPDVLKHGVERFLIEKLSNLLYVKPDLVYRVSKSIINLCGQEMDRLSMVSTHFAPDLINITLTLQRLEGIRRKQGLELFEKLLELNVYGIKNTLSEIDNRLQC